MIDQQRRRTAERLIATIHEKLLEHLPVLSKSTGHGRITWRTDKNGKVDIDLEPKL